MKKYSHSTDEENFNGHFDSKEAAAKFAFDDDPDIDRVWVGENTYYTAKDFINADDILEDIEERACDECGECSVDWLATLSEEKKQEFEKLIGDWIDTNATISFYSVSDVTVIDKEQPS